MIVRRYVVKDMPEAVLSIRKDLGKDAVILSTKKVRVKKWLGLRWQTRLEVTAAVGGDIPLYHRDAPSLLAREDGGKSLSGTQAKPVDPPAIPEPTAEESTAPDFGKSLASAFDAYQTASKTVQSTQPTDLQAVLNELASLKSLVSQGQGATSSVREPLEDSVRAKIVAFLTGEGVEPNQIVRWMDEAQEAQLPMTTFESGIRQVIDIICQSVPEYNRPQPIRPDSRIVAFVGPTGVGKTTSIAKIAALHVLAGHRKIGLLTTDTFRIAAVQQLRTYAEILDVPLVVADEEAAIAKALGDLRDCDLILVDTAGRNFRDGGTVGHTKRLLGALSPDETILVLSLAAKAEDADDLVQVCEPLNVDKFMFTKLDETRSVGAIPRLISKYHRPVSYLTTGQNVPDDIDILSLQDILVRWLEEVDRHE